MPFKSDDYLKRVLGPAVEAYAREGRLPDLFERYDLPLEVEKADEIKAQIKTVTDFWRKRFNNKRDERLVRLLCQPDQEKAGRDLLSEATRRALRTVVEAQRQARLDAAFAEVDAAIRINAAKGYLTPEEVSELQSRFAKSLSAAVVSGRISWLKLPIKDNRVVLPEAGGLDLGTRNDIRARLRSTGKKNLFDVLGLSETASKEEISRRHKSKYEEVHRWRNDQTKTDTEYLLGQVSIRLIQDDPARYHADLKWEIIESLKPDVKTAAASRLITLDVFRRLRAHAVELGLSEQEASDYLPALAQQFGASVEVVTAADSIPCRQCGAARPKTEARCGICSTPLWVDCPKCTKRSPAIASTCGDCGLPFSAVPQAKLLFAQADLASQGDDFTRAAQLLAELAGVWPDYPSAASVRARIEAARLKVEGLRRDVEEHRRMKQLFAAQRIAENLAREGGAYVFPDGRAAGGFLKDIEAELGRVAGLVQAGVEHERAGRKAAAVLDYERALALAGDAEEATRGLRRCPPDPPAAVEATFTAGIVVVSWSATGSGALKYQVVRRPGRAPTSPEDGDLIASGASGLSARDERTPPGELVQYAVFAERDGVFSPPGLSPLVLVATEIEDFALQGGDGVVSGTWKLAAATGRARVWRQIDKPPEGSPDDVEILTATGESFIDRRVANGTVYFYRVAVEYAHAAPTIVTRGQVSSIRPDGAPVEVDSLRPQTTAEGLLLSWAPRPCGAVRVYRTQDPLSWPPGTRVLENDLSALGDPLHVAGASSAVDPQPPRGRSFYTPVTFASDRGVVGTALPYFSIHDVTELRLDDRGSYLELHWTWPAHCDRAVVAWRRDAQPTGPDDPAAETREQSIVDYRAVGGFRLDKPGSHPYHIAVFSGAGEGSWKYYGPGTGTGCRVSARTTPAVVLTYAIQKLFLRDTVRVTLNAKSDIGPLPDLVVVARSGNTLPLKPSDGVQLGTLTGLHLAAGKPKVVKIALGGVRRPACVRVLFSDPDEHKQYKLDGPPPSTLLVS